MILPTMTKDEITEEIKEDWKHISSTSWDRLTSDYERKRRRGKVPKTATYHIFYEIKSAKKNKWIFKYCKAPSEERYKGSQCINILSLTYYYTPAGLRVFKIMPHSESLSVYNGHLFTRYKERMGITIVDPIKSVKAFFKNNGHIMYKQIPKDGKEYTIGVCKDGLLLGEKQGLWMVNKTFLSRDYIRSDQDTVEKEVIEILQKEVEEIRFKPFFNKAQHVFYSDIYKGING